MLRAAQETRDNEKLALLIPKMRSGECDVVETWFFRRLLPPYVLRHVTEKVMQLLREVPEDGVSPRDAWLRAIVTWKLSRGALESRRRAKEILKAHEQDPLCAALLAELYLKSDERAENLMALELLQRSANAGCAEGIYALGQTYAGKNGACYRLGLDCDEVQADELMRRAADMSHPGALTSVGSALISEIESNQELGIRYLEKAASLGDGDALIHLSATAKGKGDGRRAFSLARKAIVLGSGDLFRGEFTIWTFLLFHSLIFFPFG